MARTPNTPAKRVKQEDVMDGVNRRSGSDPTLQELAIRDRKWYVGLVLVPVCLFVVMLFGEMVFRVFSSSGALAQMTFDDIQGFWFFIAGCLCWLLLLKFRYKPIIVYVFAHEITHALAVVASRGQVHDMSVTKRGGYVETNKTNWFITLAPYLVPLYTLVVFALLELGRIFYNLDKPYTVLLDFWQQQFKPVWVFYYWIGLTWSFHISFTWEVLKTEQSDLLHNGEFFSLILIFGANLAILLFLFFLASPKITVHDLRMDAVNCASGIWEAVAFVAQSLWHLVRNDR